MVEKTFEKDFQTVLHSIERLFTNARTKNQEKLSADFRFFLLPVSGHFIPLVSRLGQSRPSMFALAISKCYGEVRVPFFLRDNSLVSARNSHSSGVRDLVLRCLLFNPEGSCSNRCVCANFFTSIPKHVSTFFGTMRLPLFGVLKLFREFFDVLKNSPPFIFFDILQRNEC